MNLCLAGVGFMLKTEKMLAWPVVVKIDISPLCNLQCTSCVHAKPNGDEYLEKQHFHPSQKMSVELYRRIINEIKGRSTAVSLYYLGDPLVHPDLDEMCRIAYKAGLNVHVSTNFSFRLSEERIRSLMGNGLTHLTVCLDGLSQEKYGVTRVGGNIEWVLSNLELLCHCKRAMGLRYPKIEVQYITFTHNRDELEPALRLCKELGVDQVSTVTGSTSNWTRQVRYKIDGAKRNKSMPQCLWPYFFMLVKYDGDVIPCCCYRVGEQYSLADDSRSTGNVFQTSIWEAWNSPKYRQIRRLVSNPAKGALEAQAERCFCYGCWEVYV